MIVGKFSCTILHWIVLCSRYTDLLENLLLRRHWSLGLNKQLLLHTFLKFYFSKFFMKSWCCYILMFLLPLMRTPWGNWNWVSQRWKRGRKCALQKLMKGADWETQTPNRYLFWLTKSRNRRKLNEGDAFTFIVEH